MCIIGKAENEVYLVLYFDVHAKDGAVHVCNKFFTVRQLQRINWASKASPTLGCSIEISRDIYVCMYVCMYVFVYVCMYECLPYVKIRRRNYVAQTSACSKSVLAC